MNNVTIISESNQIIFSEWVKNFEADIIEVELTLHDYTSYGEEYIYDGDTLEMITKDGHYINFDLKISGTDKKWEFVEEEFEMSNIQLWINGEDEFELTEDQKETLGLRVQDLITTNKS